MVPVFFIKFCNENIYFNQLFKENILYIYVRYKYSNLEFKKELFIKLISTLQLHTTNLFTRESSKKIFKDFDKEVFFIV